MLFFLTNSTTIISGLVHLTGEKIYGFKKDERFRFIFYSFNIFLEDRSLFNHIEINWLHSAYISTVILTNSKQLRNPKKRIIN